MYIRTRNELIKFIEDNAPSRAILRAVLNHNENLGGFRKLPVGIGGGWIARATSNLGREWLLAVQPCIVSPTYRVHILYEEVPWRYYEGHTSENLLYQGDNPEKYKELMEKEIKDGDE